MTSAVGWCCLWVTLPLVLLRCPGLTLLLLEGKQVALVEIYLEQQPVVSALLHGDVVESGKHSGDVEQGNENQETVEGELVLVSPGAADAGKCTLVALKIAQM